MSDRVIFDQIRDRLAYAREQHPEGTQHEDIWSEFQEYLDEDQGTEAESSELLDVVVTCIRVLMGGDKRGVAHV